MNDVRRVRWLAAVSLALFYGTNIANGAGDEHAVRYPDVMPGYSIAFPADEGSHPEFRTEWWYITGWLTDREGRSRGFQVTFFRSRPGIDEDNPSRFAAKQILFAHAAVSDPGLNSLLAAERSARAGFGLAEAAIGKLDIHIDDWSLRRDGEVYRASVATEAFALDLEFRSTQPPLLQGKDGFSQKGPDPLSSSYYYSLPQLSARGSVRIDGESARVDGIAWLDHEWSSTILDEQAVGWDWVGLNLDDGSAVMAFQMRDRGGAAHWAAASWRSMQADGEYLDNTTFTPDEIDWTPLRRWRSPRTGIEYPIEWRIAVGERTLTIEPLMDDQENDARGSTGTIYWEGAVRARDELGEIVGRGYLELTGYGGRRVMQGAQGR